MLDYRIPEQKLEPYAEFYIVAGCGHEVYDEEDLFEWEHGITLCPDCMQEKFDELSVYEKAALLGCRHAKIGRCQCNEWVY